MVLSMLVMLNCCRDRFGECGLGKLVLKLLKFFFLCVWSCILLVKVDGINLFVFVILKD